MTQAARPQTPWLVPVGAASDIEHKEFTIACRGHVQIGKVLGYLIVAASWQVKKDGSDMKNCEVVELEEVSHKNILAQVKISQNSLTTYIKQLVTWGYIQADTYRHTYQVYPQKINEAVATPPPPFEKKPRGKHAPLKILSDESQVKIREEKITKLRKRITTLGIRFSNLGNQITTLRIELSNLGITETCEGALEQGVIDDSQALRIYKILENYKDDSLVVSASAESDGVTTFLSSLSLFEENLKEIQQNGRGPLDGTPRLEGEHTQEGLVKSAETSLSSGSAGTSALQDSTSTSETLQEIPTQVALLPAVPVEPTKTPPTNKTVGKGKSKIPDPVPLCSPRTIREAIDAIRGYALEEVGAIIHQNKVLKEWCQKHTLEEYQYVIEHVTRGHCANKKHQFWREGTNLSSFFNADKLAELTPGILAELGHIPKPVAPPEVTPKEEKIIGWQPQRRITPPKGVTVTYA
jgi:hypothetical protein